MRISRLMKDSPRTPYLLPSIPISLLPCHASSFASPPGGGNSHMKGAGILVENFELHPLRRPIWAWP